MRAVQVGANVRRDMALQFFEEAEAAERAHLQLQLEQWRVRTAKAMAKVKVLATVTMAIVKLKMQWKRDRRAKQQCRMAQLLQGPGVDTHAFSMHCTCQGFGVHSTSVDTGSSGLTTHRTHDGNGDGNEQS